jgi:hypothetical protein
MTVGKDTQGLTDWKEGSKIQGQDLEPRLEGPGNHVVGFKHRREGDRKKRDVA